MIYSDVEILFDLFKSKSPNPEFIYTSPTITGHGENHVLGGLMLFDGIEDNASKIASIGVEGHKENNIFIIKLYIGWDEYKIIENVEFAKEIINRFVKIPQKQLK